MNAEYTGKKIAELRKARGLTQKELAARIHVTDKAVSKWERGLNFPDLGKIEELAEILDTAPAQLLGLEEASREEIVSSFTELSSQQSEEAAKDIQTAGWISLAAGILIYMVPQLGMGGETILFCGIAGALVFSSLVMLHRYGAIRRWELMDIVLAEITAADIIIYFAVQLFTGRNPHWMAAAVFVGIAAVCIQLLFYQMMKPYGVKAVPVVISIGLAFWGILLELASPAWQNMYLPEFMVYYVLPLVCCMTVWIVCRKKDAGRPGLMQFLKPVAAWILVLCLAVMVCGQTMVEKACVKVFHGQLESYALERLEQSGELTYDEYGPWDVTCRPEEKQVEFHTGGFGFGSETAYCGFYYSPDNQHKACMQAEGVPLNVSESGNLADWYGEGDNWGRSTRLMENWFWYEVYF